MHDIRAIRENPAAFDAAMARRGISGASSEILDIDTARRANIVRTPLERSRHPELFAVCTNGQALAVLWGTRPGAEDHDG